MAKTKYVNSTQLQKELFKRTEGYAANVRAIYQNYLLQIINASKLSAVTSAPSSKRFSTSTLIAIISFVFPVLPRIHETVKMPGREYRLHYKSLPGNE